MRIETAILLSIGVIAGCVRYQSQSGLRGSRAELPAQTQSIQEPPTSNPTPAEDTQRYIEWMNRRGKPIADKPHEAVSLRIGDWGFFYHGDRPTGSWTPLRDRVALDRSGHAVTEEETGDWYALLNTGGLDAAAALKRGIIYLTNQAIGAIFRAWKRCPQLYSKQSSSLLILITASGT
jgi:hypothetical protein